MLIAGTETFGYDPNSNLTNRFGEGENATAQAEVTTIAPTNTDCADIGSKVRLCLCSIEFCVFMGRKFYFLS